MKCPSQRFLKVIAAPYVPTAKMLLLKTQKDWPLRL